MNDAAGHWLDALLTSIHFFFFSLTSAEASVDLHI